VGALCPPAAELCKRTEAASSSTPHRCAAPAEARRNPKTPNLKPTCRGGSSHKQTRSLGDERTGTHLENLQCRGVESKEVEHHIDKVYRLNRCEQHTPLQAVGVGRRADMSITGFHPFWEKTLSQNLQSVADQGCHLEGSSPYKGTACRGEDCMYSQLSLSGTQKSTVQRPA
jgi:hypothetical protein